MAAEQSLESEAAAEIPATAPHPEWPQQGQITFTNVRFRYRSGLPLVLKGIDIDVRPREKLGLVGRTGSGKSTLVRCLFRTCELAGGTITIGRQLHTASWLGLVLC